MLRAWIVSCSLNHPEKINCIMSVFRAECYADSNAFPKAVGVQLWDIIEHIGFFHTV